MWWSRERSGRTVGKDGKGQVSHDVIPTGDLCLLFEGSGDRGFYYRWCFILRYARCKVFDWVYRQLISSCVSFTCFAKLMLLSDSSVFFLLNRLLNRLRSVPLHKTTRHWFTQSHLQNNHDAPKRPTLKSECKVFKRV